MNKNTLAVWLLRAGLSFVFLYASVEIYNNPANFLKYVPEMVTAFIPMDLFLPLFGVAEVLLGVWLLVGWKGQYPSMLSALMMAGIVAFNMEHFTVLFRNVAIGFGSLALVLLESENEDKKSSSSNSVKQAA